MRDKLSRVEIMMIEIPDYQIGDFVEVEDGEGIWVGKIKLIDVTIIDDWRLGKITRVAYLIDSEGGRAGAVVDARCVRGKSCE